MANEDAYDPGIIPSWLHTLKRRQERDREFQVPWPPRGAKKEPNWDDIHKGVTSQFPKTLAYLAGHPANDNYAILREILDAAFAHAATGKGKERHARDLPFDKQPMMTTARQVGVGFALGQAIKKAGESAGMIERGQYGAAEAECLGAINYLAGAILWMRERAKEKDAA